MNYRMKNRGFTLVELLIVSILVAILSVTALAAWSSLSTSTFSLRDRARVVAELRMAVEHLQQDLGGAASAVPRMGDGLHIDREDAVGALAGESHGDGAAGIDYFVTDGNLVRRNILSGVGLADEIVVASGLSNFDVTRPGGEETYIYLAAGTALNERTVTLVWMP